MKEATKASLIYPIVVAIIVAAIFGFLSYLFITKENQLRIQLMQDDMNDLSRQIENGMDRLSCQIARGNDSINNVKLFIASAHPEKDLLPLSSANKLNELKPKEIATLVAHIGKYPNATSFSQKVSKDDPRFGSVLADYHIDQNDLQSYWKAASCWKP